MGVPFSTALRLVGGREPAFVPWVLGVNGAAAVLASVLAIVVAMELGFRAVLLLGAGLYAVAAMTLPRRG
jgi:predicted MFS family arabinose efflux permease